MAGLPGHCNTPIPPRAMSPPVRRSGNPQHSTPDTRLHHLSMTHPQDRPPPNFIGIRHLLREYLLAFCICHPKTLVLTPDRNTGYGSSAPRTLNPGQSANVSYAYERSSVPSTTRWQGHDTRDITAQAGPTGRPHPGTTGPVRIDACFERLSFQPSNQAASAHDPGQRRTSQGSWHGRRDSAAAGSRNAHSRQSSGQQRELADGRESCSSAHVTLPKGSSMMQASSSARASSTKWEG